MQQFYVTGRVPKAEKEARTQILVGKGSKTKGSKTVSLAQEFSKLAAPQDYLCAQATLQVN